MNIFALFMTWLYETTCISLTYHKMLKFLPNTQLKLRTIMFCLATFIFTSSELADGFIRCNSFFICLRWNISQVKKTNMKNSAGNKCRRGNYDYIVATVSTLPNLFLRKWLPAPLRWTESNFRRHGINLDDLQRKYSACHVEKPLFELRKSFLVELD